jgi:hypothetical protein
MFDGPTTPKKFEIDATTRISFAAIHNPAENAGFCDDADAYDRLKTQAIAKILESAPKGLRARLESGDF